MSQGIALSPKVKEYLEKYAYVLKDNKGQEQLIPILREIQVTERYLPQHAIVAVAYHLDIPLANVYGVATFYNFFKLEKQGDYVIAICEGTACHITGAPNLVKNIKELLGLNPGEMTKDGKFSFEIVRCLGMCASAPVMVVNGKVYTKVTTESMKKVIEGYKNGN